MEGEGTKQEDDDVRCKRMRVAVKRSDSLAPSCVSCDRSITHLIDLSGGSYNLHSGVDVKRSDSPVPSCISCDRSINNLIDFSGQSFDSLPRVEGNRGDERVSSYVSLKSDQSLNFIHYSDAAFVAFSREPSCNASLKDVPRGAMLNLSPLELGKTTTHVEKIDVHMKTIQKKHKSVLKKRFELIFEGLAAQGNSTPLHRIYTELYITPSESEGVNYEHEVWQLETAHRTQSPQEMTINFNDIFKPLPGQEKPIRTVLTKGIAGIGKTVSVHKFILDWAEGRANDDIKFIFPISFRELNLIRLKNLSLKDLLLHYHPEIKGMENFDFCFKTLFIFDGLDESRLPLDFSTNENLTDVTEVSSVDMLLKNLIKGNLLPSSLLWITSRPAAASQIPPDSVSQVTEIRGFDESQKEEYFRKRFSDLTLTMKIITHVKTTRSLNIMCHIPLFCWISSVVLAQYFTETDCGDIPKTLTEMYTHFILLQTNAKNKKYDSGNATLPKQQSDEEIILKLAKLAFLNLKNGNLIFYEEDLRRCGIDLTEAAVHSGICTEILKEESLIFQSKVYCFVHLSIQEYLAALYILQAHADQNVDVYKSIIGGKFGALSHPSLSDLLKGAVVRALESKNGHLDLFVRFLLGLSLDSNQNLLRRLIQKSLMSASSAESVRETVYYIKRLKKKDMLPDRCINLLHCLSELKDVSLIEEVQNYLRSGEHSGKLTIAQCSALAYVLLMSDEVLDEFVLRKYHTTEEGRRRLVPIVKCSRRAVLASCYLTMNSFATVASALQISNSALRELNLSYNNLQDSGAVLLSMALRSPHCKLETLDLSNNKLGDSGVKLICTGLQGSFCKLHTLMLRENNLTDGCCADLASVLRSHCSEMKDLELQNNDLQDSGVMQLSAGLKTSGCKLHRLGLSGCRVTEKGCAALAEALQLNQSHLRDLDISYNHPGELGIKLLTAALQSPECALEKLNTCHGEVFRDKPGLHKYACKLSLDPNTQYRLLVLSEENTKCTQVWNAHLEPYDHPDRFDHRAQVLCREALCSRCYWEVVWSGKLVRIGAVYRDLSRKKGKEDTLIGRNQKSWSLECSGDQFFILHHNIRAEIPVQAAGSRRVGVYLDWSGGTLSFYSVSSGMLTHLHTFWASFTQPLLPGFFVYTGSSISFLEF